jgi:hypothetical protein
MFAIFTFIAVSLFHEQYNLMEISTLSKELATLCKISDKENGTLTFVINETAYQSWWSSECVRLSASGLPVAERCGAETFYGHLDETLDSREL